jgi:hypothetical protein
VCEISASDKMVPSDTSVFSISTTRGAIPFAAAPKLLLGATAVDGINGGTPSLSHISSHVPGNTIKSAHLEHTKST